MRLFSRSIAPPPAPTVEAIFHKDIGFIMRVLGRCGVPDADVEDVAQEVMRAVMGALPTFDPERPRRPWLWGIAVRQAGSYLRRTQRHRAQFVDDAEDFVDTAPSVEAHMIDTQTQDEDSRAVRAVVDEIDFDRRVVLLARVVHGMSELETAEALSIPLGTMKSRLRAAKKDLRDGLARSPRRSALLLLPFGKLLADEFKIPAVPVDVRARLWEHLQSLLLHESGPPPNDGGPAPGRPPANDGGSLPGRLPLAGLRRLLNPEVMRVVGSAIAGGALVFALGPINPTPAALTPTREALAALSAVPLQAGASASLTVSAAPTTTPSAARVIAPSAPASAASETADLKEPPASAALIQAATVAFYGHDTAKARETLEHHAKDYPRSKLALTRDLLWVRVLLSEGKRTEARAKADALRKAAPKSAMVQSLDSLFSSAEPSP